MLIIFTVSYKITTQNTEAIIKNDRILDFYFKYQHSIPQPKCEEKNKKIANYFFRFWSNPKPKYEDNNQEGKNFRGFLKQHSIPLLKCKDKYTGSCSSTGLWQCACAVSPEQIIMFYF